MRTPLRSPRTAARHRLGRGAALVAFGALAACSDKGGNPTGPSDSARDLTGSYSVSSVAGQSAQSVGLSGSFVIQPGNRWTMSVSDNTGAVNDNGTYSGEAGNLSFTSAKFGDRFGGSAEQSNSRLTVRYDFGGRTGTATLVFTR
jgi:hypothetical protein